MWFYHVVSFRWGYGEIFFLVAKENEKSEILRELGCIKQEREKLCILKIVVIFF